jgi:hypothetical protein
VSVPPCSNAVPAAIAEVLTNVRRVTRMKISSRATVYLMEPELLRM